MKNLKVTWEANYELHEDGVLESFGTTVEEVKELVKKCTEISNKDDIKTASDLAVKFIEEDLITGPVAFALITMALQYI